MISQALCSCGPHESIALSVQVVLELIESEVICKVAFQLENAPWTAGGNVSFSSPDQNKVGDHGYADRFVDPVDIFGDLVLPQAEAAFELFEKHFH